MEAKYVVVYLFVAPIKNINKLIKEEVKKNLKL